MKVVFIEDVPNVAEVGEIKEVPDGYGRNYLLPRKLAVLSNSAASNVLEVQLKKKARLQAQTEIEMTELATQLEDKEIIIKAKAGVKDRLYGSITSTDIADGINSNFGFTIDKRKIELDEPIRELGSYDVAIRLFKDIIPKIKLLIVAEEEEKAEEKKKESKPRKTKAIAEKVKEEEVEGEELTVDEKAEEKKKESKPRKTRATAKKVKEEEVEGEELPVEEKAEEEKLEEEQLTEAILDLEEEEAKEETRETD
ncbi:50S ribosomal protein L9 [Chloroflexota bacterium]